MMPPPPPDPSRRRVSFSQLEALWEILNRSRDIALGFNKTSQAREFARRMWEEAALTLNSMGDGAVKDGKGWSKYWNDYKSKLKKLAAAQRSSSEQTGGGPSTVKPMTEIEKKFLQILGDNFGIGLPGVRVEPFEEETPVQSSSVPIADEDVTWDQPGPSWRVTPPRLLPISSPVHTPPLLVHSPSPPVPTPPPPVPTPPPRRDLLGRSLRGSPRRRRLPRDQPMSAEAARRALVRESQRRADIDERNSLMLRELVDNIKEMKEMMQS